MTRTKAEKAKNGKGKANSGREKSAKGCRVVRPKDARTARKLLARLAVQLQQGTVDSGKARSIGYLLAIYLGSLKTEDFETRLNELETKLNIGGSADVQRAA